MQENSSSLRGLQNITTCSAFVDGTSSSTLMELVICGANNEECLRSGLQKCLTSLRFIAAAEGLSFFFQNSLDWLSWKSVTEFKNFFLQNAKKNCYTNHTNCYAIQFSCRRNCYANFDSKFIPDGSSCVANGVCSRQTYDILEYVNRIAKLVGNTGEHEIKRRRWYGSQSC